MTDFVDRGQAQTALMEASATARARQEAVRAAHEVHDYFIVYLDDQGARQEHRFTGTRDQRIQEMDRLSNHNGLRAFCFYHEGRWHIAGNDAELRRYLECLTRNKRAI